MGCICCRKPFQEPDETINQNVIASKVLINNQQQASPHLAHKYRDQGKIYFNSGNFVEAIKSYELALFNDPTSIINYTNLALGQKASHKFEESILTINRMEQKIIDKNKIGMYEIKGKIIKARCQSILVKNFCTSTQVDSNLTIQKANKLIKQSIKSLKQLLENQQHKKIAQTMNASRYLQNSNKIEKILRALKKNSQYNQLQIYLQKKLNKTQSINSFKSFNMEKYFQKSTDILKQIQKMQKSKQKQQLNNDDEQQQFIIDPITYEQFVNPILVKSGLTYEEATLKSHYATNGTHDPITKQKYEEFGVRNNTLKSYINQTKKIIRQVNQLKFLDM